MSSFLPWLLGIRTLVCRKVNSADDNGAVMGNWSDDFGGGTPPTKWLGSQKILQQYYRTRKPVKYGQCWVFSGVLATICRALGLPCRVVTNYASAHDTQSSLTVDYFVDAEGRAMEELNSDSIWQVREISFFPLSLYPSPFFFAGISTCGTRCG